MKLCILNDTHCGARNSSDIFIKYQEKFYEEVFFPYLLENDIKNIIHLGDYYEHRKFINFKALNSNRHVFLDKLREYGINMTIIPGNHDVFYKNSNDLCSLKELMGWYTDCVDIVQEPKVYDFGGLKLGLIPWINNENYHDSIKFLEQCKADVIGAHLELEGFEMMKGVINTHGMNPSLFKRFELVLSGHFHTKSTQGNIQYLGSQMEFTWADCNDPKHFHILDTETREVTPVRNPLTLFEKVYYNDVKNDYSKIDVDYLKDRFVKVIVDKKTDPFTFDRFIDRISNVGVHELKIAETFDEFEGMNVSDENITIEDTTVLLDQYVDNVETDLDKEKVKGVMRNIFVEASNLEIV